MVAVGRMMAFCWRSIKINLSNVVLGLISFLHMGSEWHCICHFATLRCSVLPVVLLCFRMLDELKRCVCSYYHWIVLLLVLSDGIRLSSPVFLSTVLIILAFINLWRGADLYLSHPSIFIRKWRLITVYLLAAVFLRIAALVCFVSILLKSELLFIWILNVDILMVSLAILLSHWFSHPFHRYHSSPINSFYPAGSILDTFWLQT